MWILFFFFDFFLHFDRKYNKFAAVLPSVWVDLILTLSFEKLG